MGTFYANVQFIGGTNATFRVLFALRQAPMGPQFTSFLK